MTKLPNPLFSIVLVVFLAACLAGIVLPTSYAQSPSPPTAAEPRRENPRDLIVFAHASNAVERLLFDGDFAITFEFEKGRARYTRGLDLFRKGLKAAQKQHAPESIAVARRLIVLAEKAIKGYDAAELAAKSDVAQGRFRYKIYGLSGPSSSQNDAFLQSTYGIQIVNVAGCLTTYEEVAQVEAYNKVSVVAMRRKFGNEVVAKLPGTPFGP